MVDQKAFNETIAGRNDIGSPEELMQLYDNETSGEGKFERNLTVQKRGESTFILTLIKEGLADDSVEGTKTVLTAEKSGKRWTVTEIKRNWKCKDGRGHSSWGTGLCQ